MSGCLRNVAAKRAIAALAATFVPPGASVLIDAGSTCLEAGKALFGRKDVRIITHSVTLVEAARQGEAELLCVGGELRKISGALTGGQALGILATIRADLAFIGASGLDAEEGCSNTQLFEAEMTKAILSRAKRKILLADSTKWERPSIIASRGGANSTIGSPTNPGQRRRRGRSSRSASIYMSQALESRADSGSCTGRHLLKSPSD